MRKRLQLSFNNRYAVKDPPEDNFAARSSNLNVNREHRQDKPHARRST